MSPKRVSNSYRDLVAQTRLSKPPPPPSQEEELDALVTALADRQRQTPDGSGTLASDPIQRLRDVMASELMPTFAELVEKYSRSSVRMEMDVSNLLEGGREVYFEFGLNGHRIRLLGTVTTEAIAFHETRQAPGMHGELVSGPMLRLRGLNATVFREFICERLCTLLRAAIKQR